MDNDILKPKHKVCYWFGTLAERCCLQCLFNHDNKIESENENVGKDNYHWKHRVIDDPEELNIKEDKKMKTN